VRPYADQFSTIAGAYASYRPGYPDQLFAYLTSLCPRHELAWDCATGTGQAALPLARSFRRVVATDVSGTMLAKAPAHPNIEYRTASAEVSGLESGSVDLVTVAQALHWIPVGPFYAEVERVLVPGGVLAVWSYGNQTLGDPAIDRILRRFYYEIVGPFWAPERRHVETGYRTLPFPFPELQAPSFEMEQYWTMTELLEYVGTWSATQRYREVVGYDPLGTLAQELGPFWDTPASRRCIRWPLSVRVGRRPA
jgi:ubiquinone/menaquinone biosynthesis C-methylase UbiE